jgi:hypothetical protein
MIQRVLRTLMSRWSALIVVGAILATVSYGAHAARSDDPAKGGSSEFLRHEMAELGKARIEAAQKTFDLLFKAYRTGIGSRPEAERVYHWSRRWLEAELEACCEKPDKLAAYEKHLARMKELQEDIKAAQSVGRALPAQSAAVDYYRAEAGFWLTRAKVD